MRIKSFQGEYRWLSNFYVAATIYEGVLYPSAEHAYQAAKTMDRELRYQIRNCGTPGRAKRMGGKVPLRKGWQDMKVNVMEEVVRSKFSLNTDLRQKLLDTGDAILEEGNNWHDRFWGVDIKTGEGENHLGRILMKIREELSDE